MTLYQDEKEHSLKTIMWKRKMTMAKPTNWEHIEGKWTQLSSEVKKQWGIFTQDEILEINGDRVILTDKIQEKYSINKALANRQVDRWADKLKV